MKLGTFSVSLAAQDLPASRAFYEKLGFAVMPGKEDWSDVHRDNYGKTWVILQNGEATIGLFHGMFEKNTLTFNPPDVRSIQRSLKQQGVEFLVEADESTTGPGACCFLDPDGNPVLLDQHQ